MPHPRFSNEEIVQRGETIYATHLRNQLETAYPDKIVIIDVETGEYEIDEDAHVASMRALAKHPGAAIYGLRIGSRYVYEFGGSLAQTKQ